MLLYATVLLLSYFCDFGLSLSCYEGKTSTGQVSLIDDPRYKYCIVSPNGQKPAWSNSTTSLFGVGKDMEDLEPIDKLFNTGSKHYQILTTCVLERYYMPEFNIGEEFIFRCYCKEDKCNKASNFDMYLKNLYYDHLSTVKRASVPSIEPVEDIIWLQQPVLRSDVEEEERK